MPRLDAPLRRVDWNDVVQGRVPEREFHQRVFAAMDEGGACIVLNALTPAQADAIIKEMQPFLDASGLGSNDFFGRETKRVGALAARSPASHKALAHPAVLNVCQAVSLASS